MNIKQLLAIILIATIICWGIWIMALNRIDPFNAGAVDFIIFYASLFFAFLGTFFMASFGFRKVFSKLSLEYKIVGTSFRQSIFFAFLIVGMLFLQSQNFLTWWNVILLVLGVSILEFLFLSVRRAV